MMWSSRNLEEAFGSLNLIWGTTTKPIIIFSIHVKLHAQVNSHWPLSLSVDIICVVTFHGTSTKTNNSLCVWYWLGSQENSTTSYLLTKPWAREAQLLQRETVLRTIWRCLVLVIQFSTYKILFVFQPWSVSWEDCEDVCMFWHILCTHLCFHNTGEAKNYREISRKVKHGHTTPSRFGPSVFTSVGRRGVELHDLLGPFQLKPFHDSMLLHSLLEGRCEVAKFRLFSYLFVKYLCINVQTQCNLKLSTSALVKIQPFYFSKQSAKRNSYRVNLRCNRFFF